MQAPEYLSITTKPFMARQQGNQSEQKGIMKPFMTKEMEKHLDKIKHCQFCDSTKNVEHWIPGGSMCHYCKCSLDLIRKHKLGIPEVRKGKFRIYNEMTETHTHGW